MDSMYEKLIYQNKEEKLELQNGCIDSLCEHYPDVSKEEVEQIIESEEHNMLGDMIRSDYAMYMLLAEGTMLFELAEEKYGKDLWTGEAWKSKKSCKRTCPFGELCNKAKIQIDDKCLCYGQLRYQNISEEELIELSRQKVPVKLIDNKGTILIDVNNMQRYDDEHLSAYFAEYDWFIMHFGEIINGKTKGNNVISLLLRKDEVQ